MLVLWYKLLNDWIVRYCKTIFSVILFFASVIWHDTVTLHSLILVKSRKTWICGLLLWYDCWKCWKQLKTPTIQSINHHCGQCTYPCFPGVPFTSTFTNILSKPLAAHCWKIVSSEREMNPVTMTIINPWTKISLAGDKWVISCIL